MPEDAFQCVQRPYFRFILMLFKYWHIIQRKTKPQITADERTINTFGL